MKVAFTGSSGSGKTTLVNYVAKEINLKHISGSSGDIKKDWHERVLHDVFNHKNYVGHTGVIKHSAIDPMYGYMNQLFVQQARANVIQWEGNFVTDRSPVDNLTYMINQTAFHPEITDIIVADFADKCLEAWGRLTHVIFIRAVQPLSLGIENNGSRVHNWYYQQSVDAQFKRWFDYFQRKIPAPGGPKTLEIDFWDLQQRKDIIKQFLLQNG